MVDRRPAIAGFAGLAAAALLAGCGGSGKAQPPEPRPAVCEQQAQDAIAQYLGIGAGTIGYAKSEGSNAMPQCTFKARAHGRKVVVIANVDDGPQAYFRLLRTVDEASQIFGTPPPDFHPPKGVSGLGPFASWFPNDHWLMATNDKVLVTVTVDWPGADHRREIALAKAVMKPYTPRVKGHRNTKDFP